MAELLGPRHADGNQRVLVLLSDGRDTREIFRLLREGYQVGMLIDQDMKVKGEFVPFFGRPA